MSPGTKVVQESSTKVVQILNFRTVINTSGSAILGEV